MSYGKTGSRSGTMPKRVWHIKAADGRPMCRSRVGKWTPVMTVALFPHDLTEFIAQADSQDAKACDRCIHAANHVIFSAVQKARRE